MGIVGYVVLGAALGGLATLLERNRDWVAAPLTGACAAMLGGVLLATSHNGELESFFGWRGWLAAGITAVLALRFRSHVLSGTRPSQPGHRTRSGA